MYGYIDNKSVMLYHTFVASSIVFVLNYPPLWSSYGSHSFKGGGFFIGLPW